MPIKILLTDSAERPILVDMKGRQLAPTYESVNDYLERNGLKGYVVTARWGISPFQLTALKKFPRYRFSLTDQQWKLIAADLNQPVELVKRLYSRAA